jgi:hypothetical protein
VCLRPPPRLELDLGFEYDRQHRRDLAGQQSTTFAVIQMLPHVIRVKGKVCLVGKHSRHTAVKQVHREIEPGWP